ncbi:AbrB family transcriptional regulator [Albidovulum sediminis]|uniref:AbrB family transcriptional regulator n=1 Tax=Albidovulum sediminis TaxID=3066345 RepID=A0ABT2NUI2_9RHOB|nr:AbrB family transcriptional regulator [Defluviimonas sediminis]
MALLAGWCASHLGLPLAWVLAPMLVTAFASIAGLKMPKMQPGRKIGQLFVGSAIGLTLTPGAAGLLLAWAPLMVLTALVAILVTAVLTRPFARLTGQDVATAFFSLTPGGLSEMARVGASEGARSEVVALSQAVRVAMLVTILPLLLRNFGVDGGLSVLASLEVLPIRLYLGVLALGLVAVQLVRRSGANNPWMIGGLLTAAVLSGSGLVEGKTPAVPFALGQYLIGISIGARFERERLQRILPVLAVSVAMVLVMALLLAGYGVLLTRFTTLGFSTTILVSSPGGMAEMALTAAALHLDVMLITAFHFTRSLMVNAWALQFFRFFRRIGLI